MLQMPVDCAVDLIEEMKDGLSRHIHFCFYRRLSQRDGCLLAKDVIMSSSRIVLLRYLRPYCKIDSDSSHFKALSGSSSFVEPAAEAFRYTASSWTLKFGSGARKESIIKDCEDW